MSMRNLIELFRGHQPRPASPPETEAPGLPALLALKLEYIEASQAARWRRMAPGTLVEGHVIKRRYGGVDVDCGGEVLELRSANFMRLARRACHDGFLPDMNERVNLIFQGLDRNGMPRLYAWDLGADPNYHAWAAGYRSRYRGEDGPFITLPWERVEVDIEPYDYRRNKP